MTEPEIVLEAFDSQLGAQRGAPSTPLIIYGHMAEVVARRFAGDTSVSTLAVAGLPALDEVLANIPTLGVIAHSRTTHVGEAEQVITTYRQKSARRGMTLYQAWDYNVARATTRALACGADGITMPGIEGNDYYRYVLGVLREVENGAAPPTTAAEHEARLRKYTTDKSPFWHNQDPLKSIYY